MNIVSKITHSEMIDSQLISSNSVDNYFFITVAITLEIAVDCEFYTAELQTGHDYLMNDYSLPSNRLSVYNEGPEFLAALEDTNLDTLADLDDQVSFLEQMKDITGVTYTFDKLLAIKTQLVEGISNARAVVAQFEADEWEKLASDSMAYVISPPVSAPGQDFDEVIPPTLYSFENHELAEEFIDSDDSGNGARIVDKETARIFQESER